MHHKRKQLSFLARRDLRGILWTCQLGFWSHTFSENLPHVDVVSKGFFCWEACVGCEELLVSHSELLGAAPDLLTTRLDYCNFLPADHSVQHLPNSQHVYAVTVQLFTDEGRSSHHFAAIFHLSGLTWSSHTTSFLSFLWLALHQLSLLISCLSSKCCQTQWWNTDSGKELKFVCHHARK